MANTYTLTPNLLTGNDMIDTQHRQLIATINELLAGCAGGKNLEEIHKTVDYFYQYTVRHFRDEEQLQVKSAYPAVAQHKQAHETFTKMAAELKQSSGTGGSLSLVVKVNNAAGWLITHIQTMDARLAEHLRK